MLKPSDFNNAVPQFSNGNYASNPINPQYVEEPSSTDYNRGAEPLQTLPAQWWNWFMNKFTSRFNKVNIYVKNLFNELAQLLSLVNVTPDGTEGAVTDGQLKNAFKELYPDYINTKLALESTYVKKTQKVNNHALSGDITISKSDVGLGNVANTGDSANASSGGTTKFTTGGAYNLLSSIAPYFSTSTAYAVGALITYQNKLYECTTAHSAGEWNASHFTARSIQYVISNYILPSLAPTFSTSTSYVVGAFVIYQNKLYRCKATHSAGAWNTSHFELATLNNINTSLGTKADLLDLASAFSTSISYAVGDYVTYNGNLYRCTVAHSGAWNASHFTLVTVGGDLAEKTDITAFEEATTATTHFDNAPYTSRVTDYDRANTDSIIGASFAINQLVKNGNFASTSNWTTSGATLTVSGNVASIVTSNNYGSIYQALNMQSGHKYLISVDIKATTANQSVRVLLADNNTGNPIYTKANSTTSYVTYQGVVTSSTTKYLFIGSNGTQTTVNARNAFFIDLTQMFGSVIADRIYAMEQATEGSGISWIKSMGFFNKDYYATDEGSIQNVKPSAYKTTGFNIARSWSNSGSYTQYGAALFIDCELRPNTTYCIGFKCPTYKCYFNENLFDYFWIQTNGQYQYFVMRTKDNISSQRYATGYLVLKNASGNSAPPNFTQVCVSLADSRFDGQYEKYIGEWNYPLADTELRGIPKLDSNNNLIFDGDVYYPNGDVIRKYATVALSTLTRTYHLSGETTGGLGWVDFTLSTVKQDTLNMLLSQSTLPCKTGNAGWKSTTPCMAAGINNNVATFRIYETSGMSQADFDTKYNSAILIYELATPTSETVAGYSNPHTLIRKGAEEFVDDRTIALPVGHETTYLSLPDWLSTSDPFAVGTDGYSSVPIENGNIPFSAGGAYDFFGKNTNSKTWLSRVFGWALGRNWTRTNDLTNLRDVFYLNKMWFVFSDTLDVCWSTDGRTWTQATGFGSNVILNSMSYGNGIWIVCADGKKLYWSSDGKSWNLCTLSGTISSPTTDFYQASYGNGIWVAASFNDGLWWSTDGKTWTQVTGNTMTYIFYSVKYADGIFVAGSGPHGLWWSTDGKNWTQSTDYTTASAKIFYANGIWFASDKLANTLYYSEDGKSWSNTNINNDEIYCVCYAVNTWYFGGYNHCYSSFDGHTLTSISTMPNYITSIAYANTVMLMYSRSTGLYLSTDYITAKKVINWENTRDGGVEYGDGVFCMAMLGRGIFVSDYSNANIQ